MLLLEKIVQIRRLRLAARLPKIYALYSRPVLAAFLLANHKLLPHHFPTVHPIILLISSRTNTVNSFVASAKLSAGPAGNNKPVLFSIPNTLRPISCPVARFPRGFGLLICGGTALVLAVLFVFRLPQIWPRLWPNNDEAGRVGEVQCLRGCWRPQPNVVVLVGACPPCKREKAPK